MLSYRTSVFVFLAALAGGSASWGLLGAQEKSPSGSKTVVATIDGSVISEEELSRAAAADIEKLEVQKLQFEANLIRNRQQIREKTLDRLVDEKILDAEAVRRGVSRQDLLAKEVGDKVKDPTTEEVNLFYESNKDRIRTSLEQVTPQIRQYLKQQSYNRLKDEYLASLKKDRSIKLSLEPLRLDVPVVNHPSRGNEQAPVTIVEFSDFQCPYCRDFTSTLDRVMKEFPSDVRVVFRQLPLNDIHPMAQKAAEASLCAKAQNKFWELHDLMFKDQTNLNVENLKAKAPGLGLDAAAFNSCLDSGKYAQEVDRDIREGARLGADGTPSIFINGRFLSGSRPYDEIVSMIKEELQKKAAAPGKP